MGSSEGIQQLLFDHVAVGGTFDRLHAGHRILLATTALVTRLSIYVGITGWAQRRVEIMAATITMLGSQVGPSRRVETMSATFLIMSFKRL